MLPPSTLQSLCPHQWLMECVVWEQWLSINTLEIHTHIIKTWDWVTWNLLLHKTHRVPVCLFPLLTLPSKVNVQLVNVRVSEACPQDAASSWEAFLLIAPWKPRRLFGREPRSPDVPFDRVTPSPWVLIVRRQECDSTPGGTAELRAYLWMIRRLSRGCRHQMLCLTHLPALHHRQLGFLSLPSPAPPAPGSIFLSRCRSLGLARVGLGVWQKQAKKPRAVYLTELS